MKPFVFQGGVALLTGAASGIGRALALNLAARGCQLALVDRNEAGLQAVAADARRYVAEVSTHTVDLTQTETLSALVTDVINVHRRVTLLVNNAGAGLEGTFEEVTLEEFEWLMNINFRAVVALTKSCLPSLLSEPGSHLVNLSSIFGIVAPPGNVAYAASKFAVRGFTEALRHELAGRVGVTVVHPGGVKTNIALGARVAAAADQAAALRGAQTFADNVKTTPEQAAAAILSAVRRRRGRVLIGSDARMIEAVQRAAPVAYWRLLSGAFERNLGADGASKKAPGRVNGA